MQIAKDMERWAKSVNAAKSVQQQQLQAVIQQERSESIPEGPAAIVPAEADITALSGIKRTGVPLTSALTMVLVWYFVIYCMVCA